VPYPAAKLPYPIREVGSVESFAVRAIGLFFTDQKPSKMGNVYLFQWGEAQSERTNFWAVFTTSKEKALGLAKSFFGVTKYELVHVFEDGQGILYTV